MSDELSQSDIEGARARLESALKTVSQLPIQDVTHVGADEVDARGPARPGSIEDELGEFEALFRVTISKPDEDDILETRDMSEYLRTQLMTDIERKSNAPDTMIVQEEYPPGKAANKPVVFYVRSVL